MLARRSSCPRLLSGSLLLLGLSLILSPAPVPAHADPDIGFVSRQESTTAVTKLAGGDRLASTSTDDGHTQLTPLARRDGTRPGLLLGHGPSGSTVQAVDRDAGPTTIAGTAPVAVRGSQQDLVELRLKAIGRDGRPARAHVTVYDVQAGAVEVARQLPGNPDAPCSAEVWDDGNCMLVPPGSYSVMAFVNTNPADRPSTSNELTVQSVALVGDPQTKITKDRTITLDARLAEAVEAATPGSRTKINPGGAIEFGYTRTAAGGATVARELMPPKLLDENVYLQPTKRVSLGRLETLSRLRLEAPDIAMSAPGVDALNPEYYDAACFSDVSSDWPMFDGAARMRVVDVGNAGAADLAGKKLDGAIAVAERTDELSVAEQSRAVAAAGAELIVIYHDGPGDSAETGATGTKVTIPTLRLNRAEGKALIRLTNRERVLVRGESASPYLYDLVITEQDRIPADLSYRFPISRLSTQIREFHGQPRIGASYSEASYPWRPGDEFSISVTFPLRDGPRSRTEYRLPDPDTRWTYSMATPELRYNAQFPEDPVLPMVLSDWPPDVYEPHQQLTKPIGTAPITAAPSVPVQRSGDLLRVSIDGFADAEGNQGTSYSDDSGMSTLLQISADGSVIGETPHLPAGVARLPADTERVEIAFTADNPQTWTELSTHTETRWAFDSTATADGAIRTEPLILPDYDIDVDLRNQVRSKGRAVIFDLGLDHPDDAKAARIKQVTMDVSYDDGATWQDAGVLKVTDGDSERYRVVLPSGRGFASLRLQAADLGGSTLDQTIIRAFYVA